MSSIIKIKPYMTFKKKIVISQYFKYLFLIYLLIPVSCNDCDDSCCDENFEQTFTTIDEMEIEVGRIERVPASNSERIDFISEKSTDFVDAAFRIVINNTHAVAANTKHEPAFSFMNNTYACDPLQATPSQFLRNINITSSLPVNNFGRIIEPGSSLNGLFEVVENFTHLSNLSIDQYIREHQDNIWLFGHTDTRLIFRLNRFIDFPRGTLKVEIGMDDGTKFELTTNRYEVKL